MLRFIIIVGLLSSGACKTRRVVEPGVPTTGDQEARARFMRAKSQFMGDNHIDAQSFTAIADEYKGDPVEAHARLYAGIAAIKQRNFPLAEKELLEMLALKSDPKLRVRGQLFLGVTLAYQSRYTDAWPHLQSGEKAIANDEEKAQWLAASAVSAPSVPVALPYLERWYQVGSPAERAFIIDKIQTAVAGQGPDQALSSAKTDDGIVAALATISLATANPQNIGLRQRARALADKHNLAAPFREQIGNNVTAVIPLSGRRSGFGDPAVRGLVVASSAGLKVHYVDIGGKSPDEVINLAKTQASVALIGPVAGQATRSVSASAQSQGMAIVSLTSRPELYKGHAFHIVHSAESRARMLARRALEKGVKDFAVLRPTNGYGKAVTAAFVDEVKKKGGRVMRQVSYDPKSTSFGSPIRKLKGPWQALFIPDQARRLKLLAPALAAANYVVRPVGDKSKVRFGRRIVLLSTAEFLERDFVASTGRYTQGAWLAPGFYPDLADPSIGPFVGAFRNLFQTDPGPIDAYAYDAAMMVAQAKAGAESLPQVLLQRTFTGVTGDIRFGPSRLRSDSGIVFSVVRDSNNELTIRAFRD